MARRMFAKANDRKNLNTYNHTAMVGDWQAFIKNAQSAKSIDVALGQTTQESVDAHNALKRVMAAQEERRRQNQELIRRTLETPLRRENGQL